MLTRIGTTQSCIEHLGLNLVVRVLPASFARQAVRFSPRIAGQIVLAIVMPEIGRIVRMGVDLIVVAEERIEALSRCHAG